MNKLSGRQTAVIGLLLASVIPLLPIARWLAPERGLGSQLVVELVWWVIAALILAWVTRVEVRPLDSIGIRPPGPSTLFWGIVFVVPLIASAILSFAVILPALELAQDMTTTRNVTSLPIWLQLAIFARAGVVEEIIYRGYAIERLDELTGKRWLAAIVAGTVFILTHTLSWSPSQLVIVSFGTVILTALYLWKRDLLACMVAHALTD